MAEKILVFRGDQVVYDSSRWEISCESEDDCFVITDVPPDTVIGLGVKTRLYKDGSVEVEGTELWKLGDYWIIEYNPLFDKNQIKPPIIRGRER